VHRPFDFTRSKRRREADVKPVSLKLKNQIGKKFLSGFFVFYFKIFFLFFPNLTLLLEGLSGSAETLRLL
jgi:hypothetical protein